MNYKLYLQKIPFVGMSVWFLFVFLLTILPGHVPLVRELSRAIGGTDVSDAIGHLSLFAILTLMIWRALFVFRRTQTALLVAMLVALTLGTITEFSQGYVAYRAATLSDLLANWLGVFIVGFAVSYVSWVLLRE